MFGFGHIGDEKNVVDVGRGEANSEARRGRNLPAVCMLNRGVCGGVADVRKLREHLERLDQQPWHHLRKLLEMKILGLTLDLRTQNL